MNLLIFLVLVLVGNGLFGCKSSETPLASDPSAGADSRDELPVKKIPRKEPWVFESSNASPQPLLRARSGKTLCLYDIFAEEDRFVAASYAKCQKHNREQIQNLYSISDSTPLASFDRVQDYSDPLDMILVGRVFVDGKATFQGANPPFYTNAIRLEDGSPVMTEEKLGYRYHFVESQPLVLVSQSVGHPSVHSVGVRDGVSTTAQDLKVSEILPRGSGRWNAARNRVEFRGYDDCQLAYIQEDGTTACQLRLPTEFSNSRSTWILDSWFLASGSNEAPLAANLETGEMFNPAEGLCQNPRYPFLGGEISLPRMLITCPSDSGRKEDETYLWTPTQRVSVVRGLWSSEVAYGDFVPFTTSEILFRQQSRWLDLKRLILWDPGELHLREKNLAVSTRVLEVQPKVEIVAVDPEDPSFRSLGHIECKDGFHVVHSSEEVVSVMCAEAFETICGLAGSLIEFSVTWDLKHKKRYKTPGLFAGVTKSSLLFHDVTHANAGKPCESKGLSTIPRT